MAKDSSNTGGMGMHKHGVSGVPSKSPRHRHTTELELQREANAKAEAKAKKRKVGVVHGTVREAIEDHKKR